MVVSLLGRWGCPRDPRPPSLSAMIYAWPLAYVWQKTIINVEKGPNGKDEGSQPNILILSMFVVCLSLNVLTRLFPECSLLSVLAVGASSSGARLLLTMTNHESWKSYHVDVRGIANDIAWEA